MKVTICLLALLGCCFSAAVSPFAIHQKPANDLAALLSEYGGIEPIKVGIVGGHETTIEQFPWIVSMQFLGLHRCGASIISPTRFLSAAHCTWLISASAVQLRAGSSFSQNGGQLVQVSKIVNHPQYDEYTLNNDICTMWIQEPLNMELLGVSLISLPVQGDSVATGALAFVSGWGILCDGDSVLSPVLRYVDVPIVSNVQCNTGYGGNISAGMLCAGFPEGGCDSCGGDSGGPLNIGGTLVGIVSWGNGCARPGLPGVYTRVAFYRNWIDSNV